MDPTIPRSNGDGFRAHVDDASDTRGVSPDTSFGGRGFGELFSEFMEQARRLMRAEFTLARAELRSEAKKASAGAGLMAGGAVVLLLGAFTFVAFLVAALAELMPVWASALIVAVLLLAVGGAVAWAGLGRLKRVHGPQRTIQTLKEDGQWASRTAHSMKSQMHGHA
ncbi:phage holin family protein [Pyxidicoccus xibeiensis]|uniref:phage holin family protein n=1 Tax=Pyxidicoccus xibeiensis TaxID=2906759 RepID=UPI0020A6E3BE|nr:phage holin family protein [Pyxidicoccus xibeiensis]MCP3138702.1 phage holin family protein [Pyxidicoccus xibeiensis]